MFDFLFQSFYSLFDLFIKSLPAILILAVIAIIIYFNHFFKNLSTTSIKIKIPNDTYKKLLQESLRMNIQPKKLIEILLKVVLDEKLKNQPIEQSMSQPSSFEPTSQSIMDYMFNKDK